MSDVFFTPHPSRTQTGDTQYSTATPSRTQQQVAQNSTANPTGTQPQQAQNSTATPTQTQSQTQNSPATRTQPQQAQNSTATPTRTQPQQAQNSRKNNTTNVHYSDASHSNNIPQTVAGSNVNSNPEIKQTITYPTPAPVSELRSVSPQPKPGQKPVTTISKPQSQVPPPPKPGQKPVPSISKSESPVPPQSMSESKVMTLQRPPAESKSVARVTEDKVIEAVVVKPPTENDMEDVDSKAQAASGDITDGADSKICMGRQATVLDTRQASSNKSTTPRPRVNPGELWVDETFSVKTAFEGKVKVDWKRPGEISKNPCLFSEGTTRFDIGQGAAGTCWFLSIVAAIADKEDILKQVIPSDAYKIGTPEYDGVFHCRFWKFGEWVDIYIDDFLPIRPGSKTTWGSRSATDTNEMWVSLLEKAFAKFQGSYMQAEGGWAGDAFIHLTGGIAEKLEVKTLKPQVLYSRVKNALTSGSVIACSVPTERDGHEGLVGGHAYTLTGATTVIPKGSGKTVPLFRVRNPWGGEKGEWTGDYSDKSKKWNLIDDIVKKKLNVESKGDGEFWITIVDYYIYFNDTHVCNFTPDFDEDGKEDNLNKVSCIFGQWKGETAAGKEMESKMKNQRFIFTVPKKGLESDGKMQIVLQFIQHRENRKEGNMLHIRADLYKVEQLFKKETLCFCLDEMTNNTTFWGGYNLSYRYCLEPGGYLIVPTSMETGVEKQFLIRLFSSVKLPCKEVKKDPSVFIRRFETINVVRGKTIETAKLQHFCGLWKAGKNAGGQVNYKSFCNNPQYCFQIKGNGKVPLMISLKQQIHDHKMAIGFKIFKTEQLIKKALDINYLWSNYKTGTQNTVEGTQIFAQSFEGAGLFMLEPGTYVLIIFLESPDCQRRYIITAGCPSNTFITFKGFNTVD